MPFTLLNRGPEAAANRANRQTARELVRDIKADAKARTKEGFANPYDRPFRISEGHAESRIENARDAFTERLAKKGLELLDFQYLGNSHLRVPFTKTWEFSSKVFEVRAQPVRARDNR